MDKVKRFQRGLLQLELIEFIGVAKILGVNLFEDEEEKVARQFEEVFPEMVEKYASLSRRQRRNLDKILRPVVKELSK